MLFKSVKYAVTINHFPPFVVVVVVVPFANSARVFLEKRSQTFCSHLSPGSERRIAERDWRF